MRISEVGRLRTGAVTALLVVTALVACRDDEALDPLQHAFLDIEPTLEQVRSQAPFAVLVPETASMPLTLPVVPRVTLSRDRHGVIDGVSLTYDSSHTGDPIDGLFRPEPRFMTYFSVLETAGNRDGFSYNSLGRKVRLGEVAETTMGGLRVQFAAAMDGAGEFQGIAARWTTKGATYQAWLFSPQVPADEATSDMLRMIGSMVR